MSTGEGVAPVAAFRSPLARPVTAATGAYPPTFVAGATFRARQLRRYRRQDAVLAAAVVMQSSRRVARPHGPCIGTARQRKSRLPRKNPSWDAADLQHVAPREPRQRVRAKSNSYEPVDG